MIRQSLPLTGHASSYPELLLRPSLVRAVEAVPSNSAEGVPCDAVDVFHRYNVQKKHRIPSPTACVALHKVLGSLQTFLHRQRLEVLEVRRRVDFVASLATFCL